MSWVVGSLQAIDRNNNRITRQHWNVWIKCRRLHQGTGKALEHHNLFRFTLYCGRYQQYLLRMLDGVSLQPSQESFASHGQRGVRRFDPISLLQVADRDSDRSMTLDLLVAPSG